MKQLFGLLAFLCLAGTVAAGQSATATVSGRLMNDGKPAAGIRVVALDADELVATAQRIVSAAETDGAGRYRLVDLAPGRYYIGAGLLDSLTYYPGGHSVAAARIITVGAGSVVADVDFTIDALSRGLTVSGRVNRLQGKQPVVSTTMILTDLSADSPGTLNATLPAATTVMPSTTVRPDGSFEFKKVRPGTYGFRISPNAFVEPVTVEVIAKDVEGVELIVPPSVLVSGKVEVEGDGPNPSLTFSLSDPRTSRPIVTVNADVHRADGAFTIMLPVTEFQLKLTSRLPAGYSLKSLTSGSTDLLVNPLKISETNPSELRVGIATTAKNWSKVAGTVTGPGVVPGTTEVVLTPVAPQAFGISSIQNASIRPDESFEFLGVLPGTYTARIAPLPAGVSDVGARIVVGQTDVVGVRIAVPVYVAVRTSIEVDGNAPTPAFSIAAPDAGAYSPQLEGRGFVFTLPVGEQRVTVAPASLPRGYSVKELFYGSTDLLREPMKVSAAEPEVLRVRFEVDPKSLFKIAGRVKGFAEAAEASPLTSGTQETPPKADLAAYLKQLARELASPPVVTILGSLSQPYAIRPLTVPIGPDGVFEFPGVFTGTYFLSFQIPDRGAKVLRVTVEDKDVTGLEVSADQ